MIRLPIIMKPAGTTVSGYIPDVPGCIATGSSPEEVTKKLQDLIAVHLRGMEEDGTPIPSGSTVWWIDFPETWDEFHRLDHIDK